MLPKHVASWTKPPDNDDAELHEEIVHTRFAAYYRTADLLKRLGDYENAFGWEWFLIEEFEKLGPEGEPNLGSARSRHRLR